MATLHLEPGIYRDFERKLYYVAGPSINEEEYEAGGLETIMVTYYPLFQTNTDIKGRHHRIVDFQSHVDRPDKDYSGTRFHLIKPWELPDIVPGHIHIFQSGITHGPFEAIVIEARLEEKTRVALHLETVTSKQRFTIPDLSVQTYYPMIL